MLAALLSDAFAVLARESPVHTGVIRERLGPRVVSFTVDGERMCSDGGGVSAANGRPPDLHIETDAETVLALLDDRISLLDAVRAGALRARGHRAAVAAAESAMRAFLHGLARCPSAPRLLHRFRRIVAQRGIDHGEGQGCQDEQ